MGSTTARLALPYPVPGDSVDVPRDVQALADKLDPLVPTIPYGTTLPAGPVDGQLAVLVDATPNPTYQWLCRYNAAASTYKWEVLGDETNVPQTPAGQTTSSTTFVDLATVGPSFVVPRTGAYQVSGSVKVALGANVMGYVGVKVGAQATQEVANAGVSAGTLEAQISLFEAIYIATAGDTIKLQYRVNSGTGIFAGRSMRVRPKNLS